jgi:uncharacterized membrane protein required for colicin V production
MTTLDWIIVGIVAVTGLLGYRRGLVGMALSFIGLFLGALIGARIAPHVLDHGSNSRYTAVAGFVGAIVGIAILGVVTGIVAKLVRGSLRLLPPLHLFDSFGGAAVGVLWGLALVWIAGAIALQVPGHTKYRKDVQQSKVLRRIDKVAPPGGLLRVQKRFIALASRLIDA